MSAILLNSLVLFRSYGVLCFFDLNLDGPGRPLSVDPRAVASGFLHGLFRSKLALTELLLTASDVFLALGTLLGIGRDIPPHLVLSSGNGLKGQNSNGSIKR